MPKVKQLTVACENRPGMLAHIAKALSDRKVNILSCLATTSGTEGSVQVVMDNVNKAKKALDAAGLSYTETDVLQVELPNTLERWRSSLASLPRQTSTSLSGIRQVPKLRGRRTSC